jgi:hypothetical protein
MKKPTWHEWILIWHPKLASSHDKEHCFCEDWTMAQFPECRMEAGNIG